MKKLFLQIFLFAYCLLPIANSLKAQTNYSKIVNPFIGTGGHGHTFPGAVAPFGMVQLSPDTRVDGSWDGCSGYYHSDSVIYGFSHTHLSGTGCSDYGDILLMPIVTDMKVKGEDHSYLNNKNYSSTYSHANEKANAGYYKVKLDKYNITAELTTTTRVGMHKYSFPKTNNASIVIDLIHRDEVIDSYLEVLNDSTVRGYRRSKAWATDQRVYF
ncbi:MAG: alpha-mannosidase, partial [Bacteroidia bacterium]